VGRVGVAMFIMLHVYFMLPAAIYSFEIHFVLNVTKISPLSSVNIYDPIVVVVQPFQLYVIVVIVVFVVVMLFKYC